MPVSDRDRSRLAALIAIVKPADSLAARLDALTHEQRDSYARWGARYERWVKWCKAQHDDEIEIDARPYASMLDGHGPPMMRRSVEIALFGETPTIPLNASEDQAAQMWLKGVTR